jgi:diacylglycerol kinase family enzyme
LVSFQRLTLSTLLPVVVAAFSTRAQARPHRHVSVLREARAATIRGHRPVPYQVDGDYLGESELIELRWAADALRLVLP